MTSAAIVLPCANQTIVAVFVATRFVLVLPFVDVTLARRRAEHREGQGADMKQRLWFSLALIAVLFCFWLVLTKPMCRDGFAASLGTRSGWTCVADGN